MSKVMPPFLPALAFDESAPSAASWDQEFQHRSRALRGRAPWWQQEVAAKVR